MSTSRIDALITPEVMRWARERSKFSIADAASKIGRPENDLISWEDGTLLPSIAQARKASEVYKRPLAVFYLPEPPTDFETLRDFRVIPGSDSRDYSPKLALLIRNTIYKQRWMGEFLEDEGVNQLEFVGSARLNNSPDDIANQIRNTLSVSIEDQISCSNRRDSLRYWINKTENAGIYIIRQGGIDLTEVRGFTISDKYAPFVYLNSMDALVAQIFTLAHELVHIWLGIAGISNLEISGSSINTESHDIETFCNRVASRVLIDNASFINQWQSYSREADIANCILRMSRRYKISEEAIAVRLLETGDIDYSTYQELRLSYQQRWFEIQSRLRQRLADSAGGPSYYRRMVTQNGYNFTRTIISAFKGGAITGSDASSLLNVKVSNFVKLGETAGLPMVTS